MVNKWSFILRIQHGLRVGIGYDLSVFHYTDWQLIQLLISEILKFILFLLILLYFFDFMQIPVIQRIFRKLLEELFSGHFLIDQWERRVKETDFIFTQRQQLVLLHPDKHSETKLKTVFFLGRGRRIQFVVGRLQRLCNIAIERGQHCLTASSQMRVFCDDCLHCLAHHRQDEISLRSPGVHLFLADAKGLPAGGQVVEVKLFFFFAGLFNKIVVIVDNRPELIGNNPSCVSCLFLRSVNRIVLFFGSVQVSVCLNQLSDSLLNLFP